MLLFCCRTFNLEATFWNMNVLYLQQIYVLINTTMWYQCNQGCTVALIQGCAYSAWASTLSECLQQYSCGLVAGRKVWYKSSTEPCVQMAPRLFVRGAQSWLKAFNACNTVQLRWIECSHCCGEVAVYGWALLYPCRRSHGDGYLQARALQQFQRNASRMHHVPVRHGVYVRRQHLGRRRVRRVSTGILFREAGSSWMRTM